MILTTTGKVEGYVVDKYLGIVAGTDIYLVGGILGGGLASQEKLFNTALDAATRHLIDAATSKGADAVIGIQQSFTSPGNINDMILALTGTAVTLKKEEEYDDALPPL